MSALADYVRILGRGPGRARSLSRAEAEAAMDLMLSGQAAPEATGALLMLLRMKGETPDEIAGFAAAAQAALPALPLADLDWPSYAAGRTRGAPWFLLSARMVAASGHRVLLHGWNGPDRAVRAGLQAAGIGVAGSPEAAARLLARDRIAYLPLETVHPALFALLALRDVLGLRSCVNTVCRMLNPGRAGASVQGVFHPSYRGLQADAALQLGWRSLTVIKGGGGEFERAPTKDVAGFGLRGGAPWQGSFEASLPGPAPRTGPDTCRALDPQAGGPMARQTVLGTAALALETLGAPADAATLAALWDRIAPERAA